MKANRGLPYYHYEAYGNEDDLFRVQIEGKANYYFLDDMNYIKYYKGLFFDYDEGGIVTTSTFEITVPYKGKWHIVFDLKNIVADRLKLKVSRIYYPHGRESEETATIQEIIEGSLTKEPINF